AVPAWGVLCFGVGGYGGYLFSFRCEDDFGDGLRRGCAFFFFRSGFGDGGAREGAEGDADGDADLAGDVDVEGTGGEGAGDVGADDLNGGVIVEDGDFDDRRRVPHVAQAA